MSRRFFESVDISLPDEELAERFDQAVYNASTAADEDEDTKLVPEDVEAIRKCACHGGPKTRERAIDFLTTFGPCTWADLETWALDPDESIRQAAVWNFSSSVSSDGVVGVCASDKPRCVDLLLRMASKYEDYAAASALLELAEKDPEWLELTWEAAELLCASEKPELCDMITVCYYEHVIPDLTWGPDDPHIRPWIQGQDREKQRILLKVADWMGLAEGRIREIVEALTEASDEETARIAGGLLSEELRHGNH